MRRPLMFATLAWKLRRELRFVWVALRDRRTPKRAKLAMLAAFGYLVMPIDLIPDLFVGLGWIDDLAVVSGLLALAYKLIPAKLYAALRARAEHGTRASRQPRPFR
ncbi:MAG TPA: YkvA family protein, partial [Burkholderiaceae bacterium]|nr:YkvA family protein [Burkholderiaceae bacterium]